MGNAAVRFADVLAERERENIARVLASLGATVTSWGVAANRTFASLDLAPHSTPGAVRARVPGATVSFPAHVVVRIAPERADDVARLHDALAGPGGFTGIAFAASEPSALVLEVDVRVTPLVTILALVDVEVGANRRRIEPILPIDDDALAALAGTLLNDPDLHDASRLVETHLARVVARGRA